MPPPIQPKDRTRREHLARVERVVFAADAGDFVILALDDGLTALGPAAADDFAPGTVYRFLGRWEDDAQRGPRFRFQAFLIHQAHGRAGVVKYLTEACDGIGVRSAEKVWQAYGPGAVSALRENPAAVAAATGLSPDVCQAAADALDRDSRFQATKVDLFELFAGRGFTGALIRAAIEKWNVRAPAVIRRNPFAMLGLPSAGFKRCDRLWSDLKLPAAALKRAAIFAENLLKTDAAGHTWVAAADLAGRLREAIPRADAARAFRFAIRARRLKRHRDAAGVLWLATYHRATAEERVAAAIARLSNA